MLFSLVRSFILPDIKQFCRFFRFLHNLSGLKFHLILLLLISDARASFENIQKSWPTKRLRLHFLGQLNAEILRIFHYVQIKSFNFIEIKLEHICLKHFQYHTWNFSIFGIQCLNCTMSLTWLESIFSFWWQNFSAKCKFWWNIASR